MSPPPSPSQTESGRETKRLLAQRFDSIGKMCKFYLTEDLDDISVGIINNDISTLEKVHTQFLRSRKGLPVETLAQFTKIAARVEAQVHYIIPLLYSARRARKLKDMDAYYAKIQASRTHWQIILDLLIAELR